MSKKIALVVIIVFVALAACILVVSFLLTRTPVSQGPSDAEIVTLLNNFYGQPQGTLIISVKSKTPCTLPADKAVSEKWGIVYTNGAPNVALRATIAFQRKSGNWEWAPFKGCPADLPN